MRRMRVSRRASRRAFMRGVLVVKRRNITAPSRGGIRL